MCSLIRNFATLLLQAQKLMVKLLAKIKKHLPLRISLMITMALSLLLMVILIITLFYSRKTMKEEALNRASTTLEKVQTNIDNILLSVEESAGNMYFNMKFDDPERMYVYARKIVENNPYVTGCAIAFKPGIYNRPHFMAYEHYKGGGYRALGQVPIVRSETFGTKPYTEQVWFTRPMKEGYPMWINPLHGMETDIDPLITYSLPMPGFDGKPIGVIAVDVSLKLLSDVVAAAKPSPTSYCVLLDSKGSIIVHPLGGEKFNFTAPNMHSQSLMDAVNRMMSGDTGYVPFQVEDRKYHLFYKPFEQAKVPNRSMGKWGWSVGLAYSEEDIFGDYNRLFNYVFIIAIVGMLFMFLHTWLIIHLRLKPLQMLTERTKRIAEGHYDEPVPDSHYKDEIGLLQRHFQRMQQSVSANIGELHKLTEAIQERSKELDKAYQRASKADRMKTVFLHNMTNQMVDPAFSIDESVTMLKPDNKNTEKKSVNQLVENIQQNGNTITQLLNNLINLSEKEMSDEKGGEA